MTIYLDIVLLENIILNYIIILSTAILSKENINFLKIILSSVAGGIFAIIMYIADTTVFARNYSKDNYICNNDADCVWGM